MVSYLPSSSINANPNKGQTCSCFATSSSKVISRDTNTINEDIYNIKTCLYKAKIQAKILLTQLPLINKLIDKITKGDFSTKDIDKLKKMIENIHNKELNDIINWATDNIKLSTLLV